MWVLAAHFEVRQLRLDAARKILGMAIGMAPKARTVSRRPGDTAAKQEPGQSPRAAAASAVSEGWQHGMQAPGTTAAALGSAAGIVCTQSMLHGCQLPALLGKPLPCGCADVGDLSNTPDTVATRVLMCIQCWCA